MPFALRPPSRPRPIRPRLGTRFLRAAGSGITARTATVAESASATTVTGTRPADRQTGDYVVAHFAMTCTPAQFTGPGGSWTQLVAPTADSAAVSTVAVYGMFDPASDPVGSMSAAAGRVTCLMQAYGGVDPTTPVDVAAVTSAGTLPLTVTQVTTVTAGARLISGTSANFSTGTWTVPAGMGLVRTHTSGTGRGSALADEVRPTAGATGTRQWTADVLQGAVGYLLALRPAPMPVVREYLASEASAVNTSVTTGAGTQAGDLLLVFHSNNANTAANLTAPTTGSWTLLATGDGGASGAHVKAWSGTATGGAQTITVAPTVSGEEHGIHVVVFAGACTVDGAAGGNGTGTALHVSPAVSPVGSPRMLFSVAVSTGAVNGDYLPPPGMAEGTELDDATFTYTASLGSETLLNSGSTGTRTWTYSTSAGTYATASVAVRGVAAAGGGGPFTGSASDTAAATDVATRSLVLARTPADTAAATDTATRTVVAARTTSDAAAAADAATRAVTVPRAATDTAAATDAASRSLTESRTTSDTSAATDVAGRTAVFARSAPSTAAATDVATGSTFTGQSRTASDTAAATDVATRTLILARAGSDTAAATDVVARTSTRTRMASDTAAATDATARSLAVGRAPSDTAAATDAATRATTRSRSLSDTSVATDVATGAMGGGQSRTASDSAAASDVAARAAQSFSRTAPSTAAATDTASRVVARTRTASDTALAPDAATKALLRSRTATDSALATDVATRAPQVFTRSAADAALLADAAGGVQTGGTTYRPYSGTTSRPGSGRTARPNAGVTPRP